MIIRNLQFVPLVAQLHVCTRSLLVLKIRAIEASGEILINETVLNLR